MVDFLSTALIISEALPEMGLLHNFLQQENFDVLPVRSLDGFDSTKLSDINLICIDVGSRDGSVESVLEYLYSNCVNPSLSLLFISNSTDGLDLTKWLNDKCNLLVGSGSFLSIVVIQLADRNLLNSALLYHSPRFLSVIQSLGVSSLSVDREDNTSISNVPFSYSSLCLSSSDVSATFDLDSSEFEYEYFLDQYTLKTVDPLPILLNSLSVVSGLQKYSSQLFMILSELFSNALEHGVLELTSSVKDTPEGFAHYFSERESRLHDIVSGFVSIKMHVEYSNYGGVVTVTVEDSGKGYDPNLIVSEANEEGTPYNRGLYLVRQLSEKVIVSAKGNKTTCLFKWTE